MDGRALFSLQCTLQTRASLLAADHQVFEVYEELKSGGLRLLDRVQD